MHLKNVLFALPGLPDEPVHADVRARLSSLCPELVVLQWLLSLREQNRLYGGGLGGGSIELHAGAAAAVVRCDGAWDGRARMLDGAAKWGEFGSSGSALCLPITLPRLLPAKLSTRLRLLQTLLADDAALPLDQLLRRLCEADGCLCVHEAYCALRLKFPLNGASFAAGALVEGTYFASDKWFRGKIVKTDEGGSGDCDRFDFLFEDGQVERNLESFRVRRVGGGEVAELAVGVEAEANKGRPCLGRIEAAHGDGTFDVSFRLHETRWELNRRVPKSALRLVDRIMDAIYNDDVETILGRALTGAETAGLEAIHGCEVWSHSVLNDCIKDAAEAAEAEGRVGAAGDVVPQLEAIAAEAEARLRRPLTAYEASALRSRGAGSGDVRAPVAELVAALLGELDLGKFGRAHKKALLEEISQSCAEEGWQAEIAGSLESSLLLEMFEARAEVRVFAFLLSRRSHLLGKCVEDSSGRSLLHLVVDQWDPARQEWCSGLFAELLRHSTPSELERLDLQGRTALDAACERQSAALVCKLIQRGAGRKIRGTGTLFVKLHKRLLAERKEEGRRGEEARAALESLKVLEERNLDLRFRMALEHILGGELIGPDSERSAVSIVGTRSGSKQLPLRTADQLFLPGTNCVRSVNADGRAAV